MKRPPRLFSIGLVFWICVGLSSPGLATGGDRAETVRVAKPEPLAVAIWRLERRITKWQRSVRSSPTKGSPTAEELQADAERLHRQQRILEGSLAQESSETDEGDAERAIKRKLANLEALLGSTKTSERAATEEAPLFPLPQLYPLPGSPRVVPVASQCEDAVLVEEGTVAWKFPTQPGARFSDPTTGEAWFRFVSSRDGWLVGHTGGSRADTEIAIFHSCDASQAPVAANDDALGLLSAVAFPVTPESSWWIRVRQRVGLAVEPLLLTLGPADGIAGTVTEESTGSPIEDVRVEIRHRDTGSYASSDYTKADGTYMVTGLDAGEYVALTEHSDNHLDELWDDRPCHDDCDVTTGDPIQVLDSTVTSDIDFALLRAGTISGRVRDADTTEALQDVYIEIVDAEGDGVESDFTDTSGRFTVEGLAPGIYFVATDSEEYRDEVFDDYPCLPDCNPTDGTPIPVRAEETVTGIDFDLDQLGSIAGTVLDEATGQPIAFVSVDFYDATGHRAGDAWTNELGHYFGGGLEEGIYFVATDLSGGYRNEVYDDHPCTGSYSWNCDLFAGVPVPVALYTTTTGIDFDLNRLGGFAGEVLDQATQQPVDSLDVSVWTSAGDHEDSVATSALGTYVVEDLYPATYFAATEGDSGYLDELYDDLPCPGGATDGCDPTTGDPIAVALESFNTGIDFELALGGAVTGTLVDAVTGTPLDNKRVALWNESGAQIGQAWTDETGRYWWGTLPGGTYFLTTVTNGSHLDELFDDLPCPGGAPPGCIPTSGSPVTVVLGETTAGIDFELVLRGGLAGSIVALDTGLPLPGVAVDVWGADGSHVAATATNAAGSYAVDLSSGTYYVSTDNGQSYVDEVYDGLRCPSGPAILGLCDPRAGDPVPVIGEEPVVTGIDFALAERLVFEDGFETGDTSAWSLQQP